MNSMSQKALAASLLLLSSLAAGHAYAQKVDDPTQYEYEQLQKDIVIGKTTKEEIRAKYGEPDSVYRASAREGGYEQSWSYCARSGRSLRRRRFDRSRCGAKSA